MNVKKQKCFLNFPLGNKAILLIIGILLLPIVTAIPTFHHFYGSVYDVNGTIVSERVYIVAYINNAPHGSITSVNGAYGYDELFFVENGNNGEIITFYTNGYQSTNYIFTNEGATELNLTLDESNQQVLCGNGRIDLGEDCDGSDFGWQSCTSSGYTGGSLSCRADCTIDKSGCTTGGGGPGGGGGGGGIGGGIGGGGAAIPSKINLDTKPEFFTDKGYTAKQTEGDKVAFTVAGEKYTAELTKLREDSVTITVAASSSVFKKGDKKEFDVNKDNDNDIFIMLKSIEGGRANIVYKKLAEPEKLEEIPPSTEEEMPTEEAEEEIEKLAPKEKREMPEYIVSILTLILLVVLILIPVIFVILRWKHLSHVPKKKKVKAKKEKKALTKLRSYIKKYLKRDYPNERIVEACIKVGWEKEVVEQVMKEEEKEHVKNE